MADIPIKSITFSDLPNNKYVIPQVDATLATVGDAADAKATGDQITELRSAISVLEPTATAQDVGKALIAKTVEDGKVTEYEFGEAGAGSDVAPVIVNSASGGVASFADGGNGLPMQSLVCEINPLQDLHGQTAPYPAGGGTNKFNQTYYSDPSNYPTAYSGYKYTAKIQLKGSTTYTFKPTPATALQSGTYYVIRMASDTDPDDIGLSSAIYPVYNGVVAAGGSVTQTFTTDSNGCIYFGYPAGDSGHLTRVMSLDWQLEEGSTGTAWTPYSNVCPISGWTGLTGVKAGKNLFDEASADWIYGRYLNASGSAVDNANYKYTQAYIPVKPSTQYELSFTRTGGASTLTTACEYDAEKNFIQRTQVIGSSTFIGKVAGTFTTQANTHYIRISLLYVDDTVHGTSDIMLELGSTATAYAPYTGTTFAVDWQTEAGTVYGCTVDVLSGLMTVNKVGIVFEGTEGFRIWQNCDGGKWFVLDLQGHSIGYWYSKNWALLITSHFKTVQQSEAKTTAPTGRATTNYNWFGCSAPYQTVEDFKAWVAAQYSNGTPVTISYAIDDTRETLPTYQLTPQQVTTLLGINNVWHDANGDTVVAYRADTKLYIDTKLAALAASIINA